MSRHNGSIALRRRMGARVRHLANATLWLTLVAMCPARAAAPHFDCIDAFELIALATTVQCTSPAPTNDGDELLAAARDKLISAGFYSPDAFDGVDVRWCALTNALGFTRNARLVLLDSGLKAGSVDLVAEVLAHEMVHAGQFAALGADRFRCAYVDAFLGCGGCQDRGHEFEAAAYGLQDRVRERFHAEWLSAP